MCDHTSAWVPFDKFTSFKNFFKPFLRIALWWPIAASVKNEINENNNKKWKIKKLKIKTNSKMKMKLTIKMKIELKKLIVDQNCH